LQKRTEQRRREEKRREEEQIRSRAGQNQK
jgi:hypothetical protein